MRWAGHAPSQSAVSAVSARPHGTGTHVLDESGGDHDAFKADVGESLVVPLVSSEIAGRGRLDAEPTTDNIGNRLRFEFLDVGRNATAVGPPSVVGRPKVAAVEVRKFMNYGGESRFGRKVAVHDQLIAERDAHATRFAHAVLEYEKSPGPGNGLNRAGRLRSFFM